MDSIECCNLTSGFQTMHDGTDDLNLYDFWHYLALNDEADNGPQHPQIDIVFDPKRTVAEQRRDLRLGIVENETKPARFQQSSAKKRGRAS
jgi:hypothetical protein